MGGKLGRISVAKKDFQHVVQQYRGQMVGFCTRKTISRIAILSTLTIRIRHGLVTVLLKLVDILKPIPD